MPSSERTLDDLAGLREDTPGVDNVVHLNNAGAALPPRPVTEAVVGHLRREEAIGGYEAQAEAADRIDAVYRSVADLLGAEASEVALVENAIRAWDLAFYALEFAPGDRILTARSEYVSNVLAYLQVTERTGAQVEVVPDEEHGQVSVDALREMLDERVALVAVTHVPTQGGLVNPAAEIGAACREAGVTFLLDACQSVGQLPVDVGEIGCDILSATGRKYLRGPRGTGFLWVRGGLVEQLTPPIIDLRSAEWTGTDSYQLQPDATRFETWEKNFAALLGLGAAVDYCRDLGVDAIADRVQRLAARLRSGLGELDGVAVHDQGERRCGIVTFTVEDVPATFVVDRLREAGINTSVSLLAYARLDLEHRGLGDLVRASVHYYNTDDELDRCIGEVAAMIDGA